MGMIPYIIEQTSRGERSYDIFSRILSDRIIFLGEEVSDTSASLTESSKSPASIAKSNKQRVGTCLYQEECKLLLINCGAVIRL